LLHKKVDTKPFSIPPGNERAINGVGCRVLTKPRLRNGDAAMREALAAVRRPGAIGIV